MNYLAVFYKHRNVPFDACLAIQAHGYGQSRLESQGAEFPDSCMFRARNRCVCCTSLIGNVAGYLANRHFYRLSNWFGGEKLSDDDIVVTCALLLIGGHETMTNLIGNAFLSTLS